MAKTKAYTARGEVARRRSSKADQERWTRILIVGGVVGVLLLAGGIIAFGWYQTQIKPLGKTVLEVGTQKYSLAHLERRMRLLRNQDPTYGSLANSDSQLALAAVTMNLLQREAKLLEAASELQINLTDEEVAAEIRDRGSLAADVEPAVYAAEVRKQIKDSGLQESEYMKMIRAYLLGNKVQDYFLFFAPANEAEARGQYIVFDDENKANQALERLQAGTSTPEQVATELGAETGGTQSALTQVDWTPRTDSTATPSVIQDFLFSAQPNQISDVKTIGGYYFIVQLLERDDNRLLDDNAKRSISGREMNTWLDGLDGKLTIKENLTADDETRALEDVLR